MSRPRAPTLLIVTPYLADANNGNWRTAVRWRRLLSRRYRVIVQASGDPLTATAGDDAALLIALHARRSHQAICDWRQRHPDRAMIVALTGTDLYRDLPAGDAATRTSLDLADRLIVLQDDAPRHLPTPWCDKARVVFQSARALVPWPHKRPDLLHCVLVAHLRDEKDPQTAFAAWRLLPSDLPATLTVIGAALDPVLGAAVRTLAAADPRVRYLGPRAHPWTRQAIKRAHLLLVPSRMEGGANVVVEAVTAGTAVLGSRMSGNVGMLGDDYAGYFAVGDAKGLAALLVRAAHDSAFVDALGASCRSRAPRFTPDAEAAGLQRVVAEAIAAHRDRMSASSQRRRSPAREKNLMNAPDNVPLRLTSFSHGGGCGCKIAPAVLQQIIAKAGTQLLAPQLLVGIETSDDAAVYQINERQAIVATTDFFMPIVDDPYDFGAIAATNAISDVYAMGGTPLFALALVAMPVNQLPVETIRRILQGGEDVCARANVPIAGGHTIDSVEPIYGLVAIGLVDPRNLKRNAGAQAGDVLILGKPVGVGVYSAALKKERLSAEGYAAMLASTTRLNTPGIALGRMPAVHALTDVTGFGLLGHLLETCRGSNVGAAVDFSRVPLLPDALELARDGFITGASSRNWAGYGKDVDLSAHIGEAEQALLTDPQTSGGLLVACAPDAAADVLELFANDGFANAAVIGELTAGPARVAVR